MEFQPNENKRYYTNGNNLGEDVIVTLSIKKKTLFFFFLVKITYPSPRNNYHILNPQNLKKGDFFLKKGDFELELFTGF